MRCVRLAVGCLLTFFLLVPFPLCAADSASGENTRILSPQSATDRNPVLNRQPPASSSTLEIAPQPSLASPSPDPALESESRTFRRADDAASLNRNYRPNQPDDGRRPYIGVELEYTTQCFLGMEEHGFEVISIAPGSPAASAGLEARKPGTPLGDLETFGSVIAFPLALFTVPRLRRSGALGMPGDLIVAVDDQRVRTEQELMRALNPLRAGDTTYFTVIRAVPGGGHRTLRITMRIDRTLDPSVPSGSP